jgi:hypothetical protein
MIGSGTARGIAAEVRVDFHPGVSRTVGREPGDRPAHEGALVELMGIGEFARLSRLSAKALRL